MCSSDLNVFLGIDAGSTTTKATLIDEDKNLLYFFYRSNEGNRQDKRLRANLLEKYSNRLKKTVKMNDTIAAVATAHGVGAISIIRLSGTDALSLVLKFTKITSLVPRYATLTKIYAEGELIDEALLIYFKADICRRVRLDHHL